MQPDRIVRSLRKAWLFLRRRGRLVLLVFACATSLGLLGVTYAPQRYRALAVLRPHGDAPYPGPLEQMLEDAQEVQVLEAMAAEAGLALHPGSWERLFGHTELAERFEVSFDVERRTSQVSSERTVEVQVSVLVPTEAESLAAARYLAQTVIDYDRAWRTSLAEAAVVQAPGDEPDYRAQFQALRSSAPEADGSELVRRLRDLRQRIAEAEIKQASLLAREQAAADGLQELDARVSEEATQAYLAHLDAERERARALAAQREGEGEAPVDPRLERIAGMERQLERMLATRTRRHPEVRELVRVLEAERRAAADAGLTPVGPASDPSLDPDFDESAFQPGPTPPGWRQRAPSYPGWVGARDEVLEVRQQLAVAREELSALVAQRDGLDAAQARAEETRRELARLERLAEEQERRAEERRAEQTTAPPLELDSLRAERESMAWVGWRGTVFLALLLGLGVGGLVDLSDDSYRLPEEVLELGVPVLGVIPHLRGG
ncbi:MAG: hypothetical protein KDD82_14355 [Planctomycetes bacterium]|nr:hypothetical protein [Planctomycetota bacterium]